MTGDGEEYHRALDEQNRQFRALETARMFGRPEPGGGITSAGRHTSIYYESRVLPKHPELIDDDWIEQAVNQPERIAINASNETISYWRYIPEFGNCIRVTLRERDGTLVNRFADSKEAKRRLRRQTQS
jgi:hypothetical protein